MHPHRTERTFHLCHPGAIAVMCVVHDTKVPELRDEMVTLEVSETGMLAIRNGDEDAAKCPCDRPAKRECADLAIDLDNLSSEEIIRKVCKPCQAGLRVPIVRTDTDSFLEKILTPAAEQSPTGLRITCPVLT
jgi:hypothetical protein